MIVADQATLTERLRAIGGDWLAEKLAPKFANRAGSELVEPEGVNLAVELALYDVCEGLPASASASLHLHREHIVEALRA